MAAATRTAPTLASAIFMLSALGLSACTGVDKGSNWLNEPEDDTGEVIGTGEDRDGDG